MLVLRVSDVEGEALKLRQIGPIGGVVEDKALCLRSHARWDSTNEDVCGSEPLACSINIDSG